MAWNEIYDPNFDRKPCQFVQTYQNHHRYGLNEVEKNLPLQVI